MDMLLHHACRIGDNNHPMLSEVEDCDDDFTDRLPDRVIPHILSFLPTKDAVATSVLSKRWQYLWTCLLQYNFEYPKGVRNQMSQSRFVHHVMTFLLQKAHLPVQSLRVSIPFLINAASFNSLLSALAQCKIAELVLILNLRRSTFLWHLSPLSSVWLTVLHLELDCTLIVSNGNIYLPVLKSLFLSAITFQNQQSSQNLLSGCPVLQQLTLHNCVWKYVKCLKLSIPTVRSLDIRLNFLCQEQIHGDKLISFDTAKLNSLRCNNNTMVKLHFCNLTSLVDAYVDVFNSKFGKALTCHVLELLHELHDIKNLEMTARTLDQLSHEKWRLSKLPTFHNLTCLTADLWRIDSCIMSLMDILQKSPALKILSCPQVSKGVHYSPSEYQFLHSSRVPDCIKYCLKSFSISKFDWDKCERDLLVFLLRSATVLETVELHGSESLSAFAKDEIRIALQALGSTSCVVNIF